MLTKLVIPAAAVALGTFAVLQVVDTRQAVPPAALAAQPARNPYRETVAGSGIIEPQTENISIGSALAGVVVEVFVEVGQKIKAGDPLFRLDDRALRANLAYRQAAVAASRAELTRLENQPRKEQLPAAEAQVREAEADLVFDRDQVQRARQLQGHGGGITAEETVRRQQRLRSAQATLDRSQADLALLKAGAWSYDKDVARANLAQAQAQVDVVKSDLDRLVVRAPVDGEILQVNVRLGEFVGAPPGRPLVVLGNVRQLRVRVDIDEHDIPRFKPGSRAVAMLKGRPEEKFPLAFVRIEPYVIPKRSLTGENTERVDTRVLQVIYDIDPKEQQLFVGQQMDVFLEADE